MDGHWLDLARHANRMGARLAAAIETSSDGAAGVPARCQRESSPSSAVRRTHVCKRPARSYHAWSAEGLPFEKDAAGGEEIMVRLVTSFQTTA